MRTEEALQRAQSEQRAHKQKSTSTFIVRGKAW